MVALTGYDLLGDRQRSVEAGFDYHFAKPVDVAELPRLLGVSYTN